MQILTRLLILVLLTVFTGNSCRIPGYFSHDPEIVTKKRDPFEAILDYRYEDDERLDMLEIYKNKLSPEQFRRMLDTLITSFYIDDNLIASTFIFENINCIYLSDLEKTYERQKLYSSNWNQSDSIYHFRYTYGFYEEYMKYLSDEIIELDSICNK